MDSEMEKIFIASLLHGYSVVKLESQKKPILIPTSEFLKSDEDLEKTLFLDAVMVWELKRFLNDADRTPT